MHLSPSPNCNVCPQRALGTYLKKKKFKLAHDILFLLDKDMALTPELFFLNIFFELALSSQQRNVLLAALTAAKKKKKNWHCKNARIKSYKLVNSGLPSLMLQPCQNNVKFIYPHNL